MDKNGRLMYNGKPYTKDTWCCYNNGGCEIYGPPRVIRQLGRVAREIPDRINSKSGDQHSHRERRYTEA